jgi:haloalkane dehalogenase
VVSDLAFRVAGLPQRLMSMVQGDRRSITRRARMAYEYPLRDIHDRVAPLALARMVPDTLSHRSIPALQQCRRFAESFRGPVALVWGERDPVLGRACNRVARTFPDAEVVRTQAGHFVQEEVPDLVADATRSVLARIAEPRTD